MDKISIIIPVYNMEPYMRKCLDSVINQTHTNLEIICINDGSTDNSGKICDDYAAKDKRIKVLHKTNGGVSSAKNLGLENATGAYIGFVDSDDWIEPDMYEVLHKAIQSSGASISIASYFKDTDTETIPIENRNKFSNEIIPAKNMALYPLQRDCHMGFCGYMWNKLFSSEIFADKKLRFDENIRYGEDVLLFTKLVLYKNCTGVYCDKPVYHYYQRASAVTKTKAISLKRDILTVYKEVDRLLKSYGHSDISYWARGFYCYHAGAIAEMALENGDKENLRLMQREVDKYIHDYIKTNPESPEKAKRMMSLLKL